MCGIGYGKTQQQQQRFDVAQRDEQFLSWVAMNEGVLELEFDDDVPDLPAKVRREEKPGISGAAAWGETALRIAEARALELFPRKEVVFDDSHWASAWRFVRFLGQTFIDAFDGGWVNIPGEDGAKGKVVVQLPFRESYLEPINLLTAAMSRRTGEEWARVFGYAEEDHAAYLNSQRADNET